MLVFFNLEECGIATRDAEGQEMADVATAERAAIRAAREIMASELAEGRLCLSCHIVITDDTGATLAVVPFRDIVSVTGLAAGSAA